jgi:hypothetical protein
MMILAGYVAQIGQMNVYVLADKPERKRVS